MAHCMEQFSASKIRSGFTKRRLELGYTYTSLSEITGIKPNRIVKLAGLGARATENEVIALANALIVTPEYIREWVIS